MKKSLQYLFFSIGGYVVFLVTMLYAIAFVGNVAVPRTLDDEPRVNWLTAITINIGLILLFGFQHQLMARPAFKRWICCWLPPFLERSFYVFCSCICLVLLMWCWQPMDGLIWEVKDSTGKSLLIIAYLSGCAISFFSTFLIDHLDLFGVRQTWLHYKKRNYRDAPFRLPALYQLVRHPLYFGLLIASWVTPKMTVSHLFFAVVVTAYVLVAIRVEGRDLISHLLEKYKQYRKSETLSLPFSRRRGTAGR